MLKQIMTSPGKIEFCEVEKPAPQRGQALVKMMRIGICGSDIHVYHGEHPFTSYPVTQGHEVSGEIVALGEDMEDFRVGQKVTVQPQVVCGKCHPCRNGKYNLCEELKVMGFQTEGLACEYVVVDKLRLTALPDDMSFDEGAMIEPLAVAVHAINRFGDIRGKSVAVIGAGPIGNLTAQAAMGMGAKSVLITDISDIRLEKARECGIPHTANTRNIDFGDALVEVFGPDKADVIYDCAGNDITIGQAVKYARKGSMIVLVAVFAKLATVDLAVLNDHELDLNTSMMYRDEDYVAAIELVGQEKIKLKPMITQHFSFLQFSDAYSYIEENRESVLKVIVTVDK